MMAEERKAPKWADKPVGNCPTCGEQLVLAGHENRGDHRTAGRYTCMNRACTDRRWFNRSGEPRFGG